MNKFRQIIFSRVVIISSILIAVLLCLGTYSFIRFISTNYYSNPNEFASITKIPVLHTETVTINLPALINLPTQTVSPGILAKGMDTYVMGSGDQGVRVRNGAGINFITIKIALDGEEFVLIDGPIVSDGYAWWKVKSYIDPTIEGWMVQDYLSPKNISGR